MTTFDTQFDTLLSSLLPRTIGYNSLTQYSKPQSSFPPYDIVQVNDTTTEVRVAAAGYGIEDIQVFERSGVLHIESDGDSDDKKTDDDVVYKGIARRSFKLTFALNNGVKVSQAACSNGMIIVQLEQTTEKDVVIDIKDHIS